MTGSLPTPPARPEPLSHMRRCRRDHRRRRRHSHRQRNRLIHRLVDRGLLSYDEPVATYWPEFGANGKDTITVRDVLRHRAGLSHLKGVSKDDLLDHELMEERLAAASVARTVNPSVCVTSAATCVYVGSVAPRMKLQCAPFASQRYHWYAYAIVPPLAHVPALPTSFFPCWNLPAMEGRPAATGPGTARTTALARLKTVCFDAVTVASSRCPTSFAATV